MDTWKDGSMNARMHESVYRLVGSMFGLPLDIWRGGQEVVKKAKLNN